jgi:hypothetical protein
MAHHFQAQNTSYNQPFLQLGETKNHMISRSIYNLKFNTIYMYDLPLIDLVSAIIRYKTCHAIYRQKARIKIKIQRWLRWFHSRLCINRPSEPGRLTDGCANQGVKQGH